MAMRRPTHVESTVAYIATEGRYGYAPSGYFELLIRFLLSALPKADQHNRIILSQAYPEYVAAVDKFNAGKLIEEMT